MEEKKKILVVDDERYNINLMVALLQPDYDVMVAKNGEMALKRVRSDTPPDLILLDIMMPDMDGYEVCRHLKADEATREIPVIFVTAMGSDENESKGLKLGAVDYITKPISPAIVLARVKTHIRLSAHLQQCFRINITRSSAISIYKHQYNHKKSTQHLQIIFKIFRLIQSSDACGAFKQYHIARSLLNSTLQTKIKIIAVN